MNKEKNRVATEAEPMDPGCIKALESAKNTPTLHYTERFSHQFFIQAQDRLALGLAEAEIRKDALGKPEGIIRENGRIIYSTHNPVYIKDIENILEAKRFQK